MPKAKSKTTTASSKKAAPKKTAAEKTKTATKAAKKAVSTNGKDKSAASKDKKTKKPAAKTTPRPSTASLKALTSRKLPGIRASLMAQSASLSLGPELPANLQSLLDKGEIRDLLYRLARGLDRIDETLLRTVFHHEATLDFGPGVFQGSANDYIHWVIGVMNQVRSSHHMIANTHITIEGDVALCEVYCHAHFRMDKATGREDIFIGSRYLDRIERHPSGASGAWKIMHRKQIIDWVRTEAVSDLFYHHNPDALWSYRTKTDPSYQMAQFPGSQEGNKLPSFLGRRYDSKSVKF